MPSIVPILRARRERRLAAQRQRADRSRSFLVSTGMLVSLLVAALLIGGAFAYTDLTRDLPALETLPALLNPPEGLLLQPTRITDRTGTVTLHTFAPTEGPRRYIPLSPANPQHLPQSLASAVVSVSDPRFYQHNGWDLASLFDPQAHPTLAQQLTADLLLYDEPPSLRRALRERLLAAQLTARFGRTQILEWYLNSANFGREAYGAEAAAQLYFGKPAALLTTAESAILAAVSDSPSLNPYDAPQTALERGQATLVRMSALGLLSDEATANAVNETPRFQTPPPAQPEPAAAFINLLLTQLEAQLPRARVERGGLTIVSTLDADLQKQASCVTAFYAARLAALPDPLIECPSLRYLAALPPSLALPESSTSAVITDPRTGQILAVVGETFQAQETPLVGGHNPGSMLDAFVYLTGFTRGLSPASLVWDIPGQTDLQNFDGVSHGPLRLRTALVNDYPAPAAQVLAQMGEQNVEQITASFGLARTGDLTLTQLAGAFGAFAQNGVYFGQSLNGRIVPATLLRVEGNDGSLWLDWSTSQAQPVVTPALAYLMNHALSDETARVNASSLFALGRPVAVKTGQTADGLERWTIGYSPLRVVAAWTGARETSAARGGNVSAVLWNALMQIASESLPRDDWQTPPGVSVVNVCDPSGMLPTADCPNVVNEVFLNGNEPVQADTMFRRYAVNRETGLLATVFTQPQLIEERVYMVVPPEARTWAESAGLAIPPSAYDVIQAPPFNAEVNIGFPALFAEVSGWVKVTGTAAGKDFASYRVLVGQGLNPREWLQVGEGTSPVVEDLLAEWDTTGLNGLYAVQLQVIRTDQRVDTAIIQVSIGK